jgi:hypothetical protein
MRAFGVVACLLAACAGDQVLGELPSGPPCPGTFTRRLPVTAHGLRSGESLVDFPVLVSFDSSTFPYADADPEGADLVVLDSACEPLSFEIDRWDPADVSSLWVRLPELAVGGSLSFGVYFGGFDRPGAETPHDVFTNDFVAVYHLEDEALGDSSPFRATGSRRGDSTSGPAIIGQGRELGGGATIGISDNDFPDGDEPRTVCAWSRSDDDGAAYYYMLGYGTGANAAGGFAMGRHGTQLNCVGADEGYLQIVGVYPTGDRNWRYVCCTWQDGVTTGYVDGTPLRSRPSVGTMTRSTAHIGGGANGDSTWRGGLDEVRVSRSARSDHWIAAELASMTGRLVELSVVEHL